MKSVHGSSFQPNNPSLKLLLFTFTVLVVAENVKSEKSLHPFNRSDRTSAENYEYERPINNTTENTLDKSRRSVVLSSIEISEIEKIAKLMSEQLRQQFEDRTKYSTLAEELMNIPFDITGG